MSKNVELGHGDTPAAWTTVTALMISSALATAAIWFDANLAMLVGAGVIAVLGLAAGFVLRKAGFGSTNKR